MADSLLENESVFHPPRGSSAQAREDAILDAALELLREVGYDNMSIDAVADRARAGKATIYRHFRDKAALVARAIARDSTSEIVPADTGSLRGDLLAYGRNAIRDAGPDGGIFVGILNASRTDDVLGALLSERMWESKQRSLRIVVERAVARGELADLSRVAVVCEVCCAVVLHRVFVERDVPDEAFRRHLVDDIALPLLMYRCAGRRTGFVEICSVAKTDRSWRDTYRRRSLERRALRTDGEVVVSSDVVEPGLEPDPRRWLALGVIATAQLMVVLDATIVNIALPSAQRALHITTANRQWVITAYTLAFGGLLLLGGRIADYAGRKRMFLVGLLGFASASALGGVAQNAEMLFYARSLQGAVPAIKEHAALPMVSVTFTEPRERATAFGVYGAIAGGGAAIGLVLGGVLTEYASWRWCLLVNVPISVIAAIAGWRIVRESRAVGNTSYDIPGALSATVGLVSLVYGFTKASEAGWTAGVTVVCLVAAVVLIVGFVMIERRSTAPLLPMRVLLDRNRGGAFLASFLSGVALFGMFLFLTYYLQVSLHYSALKAGFAFLPFSGGIIVSAGIASKVLPRVGPRMPMVVGFTAAALGLVWLTQIGVHTAYITHVFPSEIVMSLGFGFIFVPMSSTALIGVSNHDAGVASATLNATQQVGGSLGTALLNTIAATATAGYLAAHGSAKAFVAAAQVHGYTVGFIVSAALLGVCAAVVFALVSANRQSAMVLEPSVALG